MKKSNKKQTERDSIIGIPPNAEYMGGIQHFEGLTLGKLQLLINKKFADPESQHNDCPTTAEILEFLKENPEFTAHGYAVAARRDDYDVLLEGVDFRGLPNIDQIETFSAEFGHADDCTINKKGLHCWFD